MEQLSQRVEDLETKLAFQEATIDELNSEVIALNKIVAEQQYQMQLIVTKLKAIEPSNIASQSEETPPPHY